MPECTNTMEVAGLEGPHRWGIILPNSSRVSLLTYKAIVAVRYPELVLHDQDPIQIGHFVAHDNTVEYGGLRTAVEDVVVLLTYLQRRHRDLNQGATAQLLVLCNRTAVHNQLLQHGFQTAWLGRLRITTTSSAAGATARIAVIVQTGCGFLSGGRRGASADDREDCYGRATVALTRAIQHTYIVSPLDMSGMVGMAQTLAVYWGGPPLGVQNLYTFPTPKTGIKQIEQFNMSPGLRKKAQDAQDAVLKFLKFSVSIALTRRLRFLRFSVYYAIYKMNRGFEIFEVFSFNRTDKVFEIFLSNGDSGYYNTIRRGPKQVATKGPAIIPPKALRILVRICSQVPAKVQSALLVACVRSLEGRREGESKKQTTHQKTKTKLSSATPNRDKTIHCQRKRNVAAESAPHPRHAAKACDNNTQTIPNNIVLWQRWATCRRGWRH